MASRTDLALEADVFLSEKVAEGIDYNSYEKDGVRIYRIKVLNEKGERAVGKPVGSYITIETPKLTDNAIIDACVEAIAEQLKDMLPAEGTILTAGLGNINITPDALGPKAVSGILATRHIKGELVRCAGLEYLRSTVVIAPGVLGQTGVEAVDIISSVCKSVNPSGVILIDALAAKDTERLGRTIQISDTGISPGAGVGNNRPPINKDTLGIPVVAVGVPTVIDAGTMAEQITGYSYKGNQIDSMMVTPREIDLLISRASRLLALSINQALHPDYDPHDLMDAV